METLSAAGIASSELDSLQDYAQGVSPAMQDILDSIIRCLRADGEIAILTGDEPTLTPTQVATRLGMSRTHLYKLLDRGEIMSHRVGRDRRIVVKDLITYETKRQEARRDLAEQFAHQTVTRRGAIDEVADLLD